MVQFHPTDAMLAGHAAAGLSEGFSLLVAAHLTYCPDCRARVALFESVGGAVMEADVPPGGIRAPDLDAVWARIDGARPAGPACLPAAPPPARSSPVLPRPIRDRLGVSEDDIGWKRRLPGVSEHVMEGFAPDAVSLLRARPGTAMLPHTHRGDEATLILAGAMKDGSRVYRRGDVAFADQSDDHCPEIIGNDFCICLIVMSAGMRFTGPLGRFLNIFTG